MSSYCSLEEARSSGATGSDAEVTAAIVEASERVERYTGELFAPTTLTLQRDVDGDGIARVRHRIQSVTSVAWVGAPAVLDVASYRVSSSLVDGGRDTISLYGDLSWADVTVLGAEPWNGGWANLARGQSVMIVGVFGWTAAPPVVRRATALLAARIRRDDQLTDAASTSGTTADAEGNVLPVVPPFGSDDTTQGAVEAAVEQLGTVRSRTTGVVEADSLLAPYVREPVRFR